jgi:hypothetical protein
VGGRSYRFCSAPDATACRYIGSDQTVYTCNSCADCALASSQVAGWCSGDVPSLDLATSFRPPDLAVGPSGPTGPTGPTIIPIGGACSAAADCTLGTSPTCLKPTGASTGLCSADCQSDANCGAQAVCILASSTTAGVCAKPCEVAGDCSAGFGCWISLDQQACWPANGISEGGQQLILNCDPTVAGCPFPGSNLPGGCDRQILGTGTAGVCRQGCDLGQGTCPNLPATSTGLPQACFFVDNTLDGNQVPTGDKLKGPICFFIEPLIADGHECLDPDGSGGHFFDICQPGSQCDVLSTGTADNLCHRLCYLGSFTPPDAGALFADGGVTMGCPVGTTCTDVFGAGGAVAPSTPIGLCK